MKEEMGRIETIVISKEDYELEDEDWLIQLGEKWGFDSGDAVDVQRNYDGEKYTVDIFFEG